jgi:hypothetical protein
VQQTLISTFFFDEARTYLDEEDRSVDHKELKPSAKRRAFVLLAEHIQILLKRTGDIPVLHLLRRMGINSLAGLYQKLLLGKKLYADMGKYARSFLDTHKIEIASFTGFWRAHEAGSLIQLVDSKGYKEDRLQFPFLEDFLSVPSHGPQPSV